MRDVIPFCKSCISIGKQSQTLVAEKTGIMSDGEVVNEEVILKQSLSDSEAFKPIYEKYFKTIFLFLLHRTGDKELAADLASRCF